MNISKLSLEETVRLKSTLTAVDNRRFQCSVCLNDYGRHQNKEMMIRSSRLSKACWGSEQVRHKIDDLEFTTCIGNFFDQQALYWLDLYSKYEKGIVPFEGTLADQPNKIIEAFEVIEQHRNAKMNQDLIKKRAAQARGKK